MPGVPLFLAVVAGFLRRRLWRRRGGLPQRCDHRQAQGAGLHRHARHLLHRARARAFVVGEHDRHRPAGGHPSLRQRGADLSDPRRGRRASTSSSLPSSSVSMLRRMDRILPYPVVITAVVVAIAIFLLRKTQFGRHTYAIGGNIEAALRAGIPVDRRIIQIYTLSADNRRDRRVPLDTALHRRLGRDRRPAAALLHRSGHHRRGQPGRRRRLASSARSSARSSSRC